MVVTTMPVGGALARSLELKLMLKRCTPFYPPPPLVFHAQRSDQMTFCQ